MKTFKDLVFEPHAIGGMHAVIDFENGYGVSVLLGHLFYSDGISTYELAVLEEGELCYDTPITDDVMRYINEKEVTDIMIKIQKLT